MKWQIPVLCAVVVSISQHGSVFADNKTDNPPISIAQRAASMRAYQATFPPMLSATEAPSHKLAPYFVGRNPEIDQNMRYSRQEARITSQTLTQLEADFRQVQSQSVQSLNVTLELLNLSLKQSQYLEHLKGMGLTDPDFPDGLHAIKVSRSKVVRFAEALLSQFPKDPRRDDWMAESLISRIRIADPTAQKPALDFIKKNRSQAAKRLARVIISLDYAMGKRQSSAGTLESALSTSDDSGSKAALYLLLAEHELSKKNNSKASKWYLDALRTSNTLNAPGNTIPPIQLRAAVQVTKLALANSPTNADAEALSALKSANMLDIARHYIESLALNNRPSQPHRAISYYQDIPKLGGLSSALTIAIEHRCLDIALVGKDPNLAEQQWGNLGRIAGGLDDPKTPARAQATQELNWSLLKQAPNQTTVVRFVRMHDWFTKNYNNYPNNESWALKTLEALFDIKRFDEVALRADALASQTKQPPVKLQALRFAARSRESLLGISAKPEFVNKRIVGERSIATAYVKTLDELSQNATGEEKQQSIFQAALVVFRLELVKEGRERLENAINQYQKSNDTRFALSYLLTHSITNKDYVYTERIARMAEKLRIQPSAAEHKDLRKIIENSVFSQAEELAKNRQYEQAADKFVAFAKEFPKADRAPLAINSAAQNYIQAKQVEKAIEQYEALLALYPKSQFAFAARWQAAELSKSIGQFLRSAKHYEAFATENPESALKYQAWKKAADMHKGVGRFADNVAALERHLTISTAGEKLAIAKEIADTQRRYGRAADALGAYKRVGDISKSSDDQIWATFWRADIMINSNQDEAAYTELQKLIAMKPSGREGLTYIANGKYQLGRIEANTLGKVDIIGSEKLEETLRKTLSDYSRVRGLLVSPCEVPSSQWCSIGYLEVSQAAEKLAKQVLEVEPPPSLNPREAATVKQLVSSSGQSLASDALIYAQKAEEALSSSGAPTQEWARRIQEWADERKGARSNYLLNNPN